MMNNYATLRVSLSLSMILLLLCDVKGQEFPHDITDICCRLEGPDASRPNPAHGNNPEGAASACTYPTVDQFAALSLNQLIDYLIQEHSPLSCIYPTLFSYHNQYSQVIFSDAKVKYIADSAQPLASSFNGTFDNGIYSLMTYLNIATQLALYYEDDITFSASTWNSIRSACSVLAINPNLQNNTNLSIRISAELLGTASSNKINDDLNVISYANIMLQNINNGTYNSDVDPYLYYYAYYFLLDVYFRYAPSNPAYINNLALLPDVISSLSDLTANTDINAETYVYFGQLSTLSIDALAKHSEYPEWEEEVSEALRSVTNTYPPYSSNWVNASLELIDRELSYDLGKDEIIESIMLEALPHTYSFDDGKFIVNTPLSYNEALSLYEAAQQVKAQFFRLLQTDVAVADDQNDTLKIKVYGTRQDYQDYNQILYGVNYPNSGGVYIESHGTFYTYERTEEESPYSLETLFRHEYTHYLQGRFLVPGGWGRSPYYDNSRLVWFEEGMAQFIAGSTIHDGIKGLDVCKNSILRDSEIPDLQEIFSSSYASGDPDVYYVYGPMLWLRWFETNLELIHILFYQLSNGQVDEFDEIIDYYSNSISENYQFKEFVQESIDDDDFWIDPKTQALAIPDIDYHGLHAIENDIEATFHGIEVTSSEVEYTEDPKRYRVTGTLTLDQDYDPNVSSNRFLQEKIDEILENLAAQNGSNIYEHSVGYFENVQKEGKIKATFHIMGPFRDYEGCDQVTASDFSVEVFDDYALLIPKPAYVDRHQFRYRAINSNAWINLLRSTKEADIVRFLVSPVGYEYSMRYECDGEWTEYAPFKTFQLCPNHRQTGNIQVNQDQIYSANLSLTSEATVLDDTTLGLHAGENVELLPSFEVILGGVLDVKIESCRNQ